MNATPDQIGRYRVGAVIGTGAFATVYRAHDGRLESDVAVKVLAENHSFDAEIRERFVLEGQLLRRVASPHVLTVHDIGENERAQPFLVLELADRGDLRSRFEAARIAGRRPTLTEIERVCRALASAMEVLHAAQVVHRDLAPGNLMLASPDAASPGEVRGTGILADDERVVVGDLGLSKDLARASGLTVGAGTAGFTPPEQRTAGGWVDVHADIWSASALLVWLGTGEPPGDDGFWRGRLVTAGWPESFAVALAHGLDADPQRRPEGAAAWCEEVTGSLRPAPAPAPTPEVVAMPAAPVPKPVHTRRSFGPWARIAASAVAVAALLTIGVVIGRSLNAGGSTTAQRTDLAGGRARSVTDAHGVRLEVTGPRTARVGQAARFTAKVRGAGAAFWLTADGRSYPSTSQVEITPSAQGRSAVVLVARDAAGRVVEVSFGFDATR